MWQKILNYYNTNAKFHSFVVGLEVTAASAITSYAGGVPASKAEWRAAAGFVTGILWGYAKRWAAQNVASQPVQLADKKSDSSSN